MFYPKCRICGSPSTSAESSTRYANHSFQGWLQQQASAGHSHPHIKMGVSILFGANEVYKRLPGGGRKRCTDPKCGHEFS